jgi:hypothetical protein
MYVCNKCGDKRDAMPERCGYCGLKGSHVDMFRIDYEDWFGELYVHVMIDNDRHVVAYRAWNTQDVRVCVSAEEIEEKLWERKGWE